MTKSEPLDKNSIYIQIDSSEQHSIVMDIFASKGWKREDGHDPRYCRFIPGTSVIYADEFFYWSHCAAGVFGTVITFDQFMGTISERNLKLIEIAKHMSFKGKPVCIGDVIDYWDFEGTEYALLKLWENKRLPIEEQSEECIDFVFSLIQK